MKHMSYKDLENKIKAEPAIISEKKKKFLEKQQKMQEIAIEMYEKKKKEQPTLASPIKKTIMKKLKNYNWKEHQSIQFEKITDDFGKEIQFVRPDGDRLPKTLNVKTTANENF